MKRILTIYTVLALILVSLSSCQERQITTLSDKIDPTKLTIVTTIFPQYDFVRHIAGDKVNAIMLLHPGAESHSFEPTPQDIKDIQNADLFIYTGGENDVWVENILDSMEGKQPTRLKLLEIVATVTEEIVEGMADAHGHDAHDDDEHDHDDHNDEHDHEVDHDHDDHNDDHDHEVDHDHDDHNDEAEHAHDEMIDEHVWTSPKNAITIVQKITHLMMEKDSENASEYAANSAAYINQLETLDADFRAVVDNSKRKTVLFGDRFPFRYLADEYGLSYYAAFTGCSTETEISAANVVFLIEKVKEEKLPAVFIMEMSNGKIADSICETTDTKKLTMYSCHNITKDQMAEGATYLSMMKENVKSLSIALN